MGRSGASSYPAKYQDHANGSFTVLDPGHIGTHLGDIALPADEVAARGQGPLGLRCTDVGGGGFQMSGKPHQFGGTWHWTQASGVWTLNPTDAYGASGHIFDLTGTLFIHPGGPGVAVGGYRYVDDANVLIEGDATYYDPSRNLSEYSEYTIGGIRIAIRQGHDSGILAVTGVPGVSALRSFQLEVGFKWYVRFKHTGSTLAVAIWAPDINAAILRVMDLSDLVAGAPPVQGGGGFAADCSQH